jgi:hypothetical protein
MSTELAAILASHPGSAYVVAPAGFGKTHLIASAVSHAKTRQLVLTHTYAGVSVLRQRMRELLVPSSLFQIETIASWALRICLSYSASSKWNVKLPKGSKEWTALYSSCAALVQLPFVKRILRSSYAGLYVDEYQDCSLSQHQLVRELAGTIPARVLGDPLQAIFDFDGQDIVDWRRDVEPDFVPLGTLDTPHRWIRAGSQKLGEWLLDIRRKIESQTAIDLGQALPPGVTVKVFPNESSFGIEQANACRYFKCEQNNSVVALHKGDGHFKSKCHALARSIGGRFASIEEVEGKALFDFVRDLDKAKHAKRKLKASIKFATKCMTKVKDSLSAPSARGEIVAVKHNTKNPDLAKSCNAYLESSSTADLRQIFLALKRVKEVAVIRDDLLNRLLAVLLRSSTSAEATLIQAAEAYQHEFRCRGRPTTRLRTVATVLLVKGLQYDHAIVLDATSLNRKELYVALTRGAKSLTILSKSQVLSPAP